MVRQELSIDKHTNTGIFILYTRYIQHIPSRRTEGTLGRGGEARFVRVRSVVAGKLGGELRSLWAEIPSGTQRCVRRRGFAVVASGANVTVRRAGIVLISTGHAVHRVGRSCRAVVPPCTCPAEHIDSRFCCARGMIIPPCVNKKHDYVISTFEGDDRFVLFCFCMRPYFDTWYLFFTITFTFQPNHCNICLLYTSPSPRD